MAALVALAMPVLLLAAGLVVDIAYLFWMQAQLQAAADMGALAGAQNVDLEALARGERRLIPSSAAEDARRWALDNLAANLPTALAGAKPVEVAVEVYNAAPEAPRRQRWSGRVLTEPTVSVRVSLTVPTLLLGWLVPEVPLAAMADASLLEKADPLDY
ncbi:MAG TPA: pilus assembly protein TadG-related protein [Bacillota bacterium]